MDSGFFVDHLSMMARYCNESVFHENNCEETGVKGKENGIEYLTVLDVNSPREPETIPDAFFPTVKS